MRKKLNDAFAIYFREAKFIYHIYYSFCVYLDGSVNRRTFTAAPKHGQFYFYSCNSSRGLRSCFSFFDYISFHFCFASLLAFHLDVCTVCNLIHLFCSSLSNRIAYAWLSGCSYTYLVWFYKPIVRFFFLSAEFYYFHSVW